MFYERSNSQNKATVPPIGALGGDDKKTERRGGAGSQPLRSFDYCLTTFDNCLTVFTTAQQPISYAQQLLSFVLKFNK